MAEVDVLAQNPAVVEVLPGDTPVVEVVASAPAVVELAAEGLQGPAGLSPEPGEGISISGNNINLDIASLPLAPPN